MDHGHGDATGDALVITLGATQIVATNPIEGARLAKLFSDGSFKCSTVGLARNIDIGIGNTDIDNLSSCFDCDYNRIDPLSAPN